MTTVPEQEPGASALLRLLAVAAVIGLVSGGAVVGYLAMEHQLQHFLWHTIPDALGSTPAWWIFTVLIVGAVGVWLAEKLPGHGGHRPLEGMSISIGPKEITSVVLASLISLAAGAVLGPEAPLLAVGSAVGAAFAMKADSQIRMLLMTAGAAAAITMILGNPMISAVLLLEGALLKGSPGGRKVMFGLLPMLVAMGFGYIIQIGVGDWSGVGQSSLGVPGLPDYPQLLGVDLLLAFPVALATGALAVFAVESANAFSKRIKTPLTGLLISAVVIATAAVIMQALTGEPSDFILFSGQTATGAVLTVTSVGALLIIAVLKTIAYSVSLGGGFRGGMLFPAVFLGVVIATATSLLIPDANTSAMAAAGIAAATSAVMRLPLSGVLVAMLLCAPAGLAVTTPAIIGSVVGVLIRIVADARVGEREAAH